MLTLFPAACLTAQEHENYLQDDFSSTMQPADRAALLMVHFGTTYEEARSKTIDAINAKAAEEFPQLTVPKPGPRASSSASSRKEGLKD